MHFKTNRLFIEIYSLKGERRVLAAKNVLLRSEKKYREENKEIRESGKWSEVKLTKNVVARIKKDIY